MINRNIDLALSIIFIFCICDFSNLVSLVLQFIRARRVYVRKIIKCADSKSFEKLNTNTNHQTPDLNTFAEFTAIRIAIKNSTITVNVYIPPYNKTQSYAKYQSSSHQ